MITAWRGTITVVSVLHASPKPMVLYGLQVNGVLFVVHFVGLLQSFYALYF